MSDADLDRMARDLADRIWRPRDELDVDLPPGTLRGEALALSEKLEEIQRALPWPARWLLSGRPNGFRHRLLALMRGRM